MILNLTRHITLVCLVVIPFLGSAQKNPNDHISKGNSLYDEGKFGEAEVSYKDGQTEGADPFISGFNLGDALFKQERYEEAATAFQALPNLTEDKEQKAAAYHNLGNSFIKAEKFQEGVDAYKQSLRNNPKDLETKYNLAYAKRMLQQQQEQEQKQDQNKDQEKKDDKEQKQDQQKQDQKKEENEEKKDNQQQQQDQQRQDEQKQKEQEQPKEGEISKEDAERMLDALNQDEKEIRDRLEKQKVKKGTKGKIEKDW
jgi:tetratricopeptide (TPR) repeat protein